jgi:hypothetical protein
MCPESRRIPASRPYRMRITCDHHHRDGPHHRALLVSERCDAGIDDRANHEREADHGDRVRTRPGAGFCRQVLRHDLRERALDLGVEDRRSLLRRGHSNGHHALRVARRPTHQAEPHPERYSWTKGRQPSHTGIVRAPQACEHAFVSIKGSPHANFQRSLQTRKLSIVLVAAAELEHVRLDDALEILALMAHESDPRFDRAAVRWIGRLFIETPPMTLKEARWVVAMVDQLPRCQETLQRFARRR